MKRLASILFICQLLATIANAQTVTLTGQVRERTEIDDRSWAAGASTDAFHLLRTRLGVIGRIDSQATVIVEVQDSRSFGSGAIANSGSPAFDLRQGLVEVRQVAGLPLMVRVGRQSIGYANERLIGKIDWTNTGQSFDAVVARIGGAETSIDLLGAAVARRSNMPSYDRDHFLTGAWGSTSAIVPSGSVQGFYLFDTPRRDSIRQSRHTTGVYAKGIAGPIDYELEGAYQFGTYRQGGESPVDKTIAASMIGARVGYVLPALDSLRFIVGYDRLSGNPSDDPTTLGAFSTLYGTNHRFYGNMDYLLNVPVVTGGRGLEQMIGGISIAPASGLKLLAQLHLLRLAVDPRESDPALPPSTSRAIGMELDLSASYQLSRSLGLAAGLSIFDGDRDRLILRGEKTTRWGFVMITAGF